MSDSNMIPRGVIVMWTGSIPPYGWALCDGKDDIPNLKGRFIVGVGQLNLNSIDYKLGDSGGLDKVSLTKEQMPKHKHSINDPGHTHSFEGSSNRGVVNGFSGSTKAVDNWATLDTKTGKTNITINEEGGDKPHENRPPYYALAYIIKL